MERCGAGRLRSQGQATWGAGLEGPWLLLLLLLWCGSDRSLNKEHLSAWLANHLQLLGGSTMAGR